MGLFGPGGPATDDQLVTRVGAALASWSEAWRGGWARVKEIRAAGRKAEEDRARQGRTPESWGVEPRPRATLGAWSSLRKRPVARRHARAADNPRGVMQPLSREALARWPATCKMSVKIFSMASG